ncbi:hypothetical protein LG299_12295 [Microbacterium lacus]|uniref:hypothetical protein n=1 Tax=Microbacterium lacus TaxID=415217 RepID=UPI0038511C25
MKVSAKVVYPAAAVVVAGLVATAVAFGTVAVTEMIQNPANPLSPGLPATGSPAAGFENSQRG